MIDFYHKHKKRIERILFFLLIIFATLSTFTFLFEFVGPFFFGLLIALIMEPVVRFLEKKLKFKRWVAALVGAFLFLAVFFSIGLVLALTVVRQIRSFLDSAPMHIGALGDRMHDGNTWLERMSEYLPESLYLPSIDSMLDTLVQVVLGGGFPDWFFNIIANLPAFILGLVLALLSSFFFMSDRDKIFAALREACPNWLKIQLQSARNSLRRAIAGYFKAQAILMGMVFVVTLIGLLILRNPYALLLALIIGIVDFLPVVGPAAVLLPWALIALLMGNIQLMIGLIIINIIIFIMRQVLQPKIMGDQMGAHPLALLIAIFLGFRIFGIFGFIIGPSFLMIILAIRETNNNA